MTRKRAQLPAFKKPAQARSANMRAILSTSNKATETRALSIFRRHRLSGWRLRPKSISGVPDIFFPSSRLVVFLDGCFWHGCPKCGHIPKTNRPYWRAKIARNKKRDALVNRKLRGQGYSVIRIWECNLRSHPQTCLSRIRRALTKKRRLGK